MEVSQNAYGEIKTANLVEENKCQLDNAISFSGYDSDETIVEDSMLSSEEEEDPLQLKRNWQNNMYKDNGENKMTSSFDQTNLLNHNDTVGPTESPRIEMQDIGSLFESHKNRLLFSNSMASSIDENVLLHANLGREQPLKLYLDPNAACEVNESHTAVEDRENCLPSLLSCMSDSKTCVTPSNSDDREVHASESQILFHSPEYLLYMDTFPEISTDLSFIFEKGMETHEPTEILYMDTFPEISNNLSFIFEKGMDTHEPTEIPMQEHGENVAEDRQSPDKEKKRFGLEECQTEASEITIDRVCCESKKISHSETYTNVSCAKDELIPSSLENLQLDFKNDKSNENLASACDVKVTQTLSKKKSRNARPSARCLVPVLSKSKKISDSKTVGQKHKIVQTVSNRGKPGRVHSQVKGLNTVRKVRGSFKQSQERNRKKDSTVIKRKRIPRRECSNCDRTGVSFSNRERLQSNKPTNRRSGSSNKNGIKGMMTNGKLLKSSTGDVNFPSKKTKGKCTRTATAKSNSVSVQKPMPKFTHRQISKKNLFGETKLHQAARQNNIDWIYALIEGGAQVNEADYGGWTPLHEACIAGNYQAARLLLQAGADANVKGLGDITPIHDAAKEDYYEVVQLLLRYGADPHLRTKKGTTAFDETEDENIRNLLFSSVSTTPAMNLRRKSKTNEQKGLLDVDVEPMSQFQVSPTTSCKNDSKSLKKKASTKQAVSSRPPENMHKRNDMSETQLCQAAKVGDVTLVRYLLDSGVSVNEKDSTGWTAIHEASSRGFTNVIAELIKAGANVNSIGLDGVLPIHDAVSGNHFKSVELLLQHGATPSQRDGKQENAFDKSYNDRMTDLLKYYSSNMPQSNVTGTEPSQVEITFPVCARETQRYITRGKRYNAIIDTLQDIENRQKNLYVAKLQTSEDTDKFIAEMRLIQDALDEVDALQKNEGDTLSKKYKASVDYFKKGILRDKIAKLASSQKKLLQVLNNQNEVAYKQSRRSNANNGKKSSSLFCSNTSPGRNQISALCTVNEGLCANHTNGSTMATMVPAACITPDSMSPAFQHSFMRYVGSPEVCSIEDVPGTRLASERREENSSSELILRGKPRRTENVLLRSDLCSGIAPADLHDKINDHLEFSAPGNNSSNSISVKSILNITDTSNNIVGMDHQMSLASKQISPAGPYLQLNTFDETSQGNTTSASVISDRTSNVGNTQQLFVSQGHSSPAESHSPDQNSAGPSANRQLSGRAERKIKRVQMKELIKTGKIKPGKDVLEFQLQGCSHKASLLLDGRIRACSGVNYRDPVQWVKALLGNDIPISWKYVINKVTYIGKELSFFITQEDLEPKEVGQMPLEAASVRLLPSAQKSSPTFLKIRDILLMSKKEFLPKHVVDTFWKQFMEGDSWNE